MIENIKNTIHIADKFAREKNTENAALRYMYNVIISQRDYQRNKSTYDEILRLYGYGSVVEKINRQMKGIT